MPQGCSSARPCSVSCKYVGLRPEWASHSRRMLHEVHNRHLPITIFCTYHIGSSCWAPLHLFFAPGLPVFPSPSTLSSRPAPPARMTIRRPPLAPTPSSRLLLAVLAWASVVCASLQPFRPVETAAPVAKRQACLANFYSCADQGASFNNICCQQGQRCALDANNNPACCPTG